MPPKSLRTAQSEGTARIPKFRIPKSHSKAVRYHDIWYWTSTADGSDAYAFLWSYDDVWLNQSSADRADMTAATVLHVTAVRSTDGVGIVPEPGTLLLLGPGLLALGMIRRRKN